MQAQDDQAGFPWEEAEAGGGGRRRPGSGAGAHLCLPPAEREGSQTPVEVRHRAPRLLPPEGAGQGEQRQAELLQNGLTVQIQVRNYQMQTFFKGNKT